MGNYTGNFLMMGRDASGNIKPLRVDENGKIPVSASATFPSKVVTVAKENGDYTSIKAANDSITDASTTNRYAVMVYPGVYVEDPIVMHNYVDIIAVASNFVTKITANNVNSPMFTGSGLNLVSGFIVNGVTNDAAFLVNTANYAMSINGCTIYNCKYGVQCTNGLVAASHVNTAPLGSMTIMFYANGGEIDITHFSLQGNAAITTVGKVDSSGSMMIEGTSINGPNVSVGFEADNGNLILSAVNIDSVTTCILTNNASIIEASAIRCGYNATTHLKVDDLASIIHVNSGEMSRAKMDFVAGYSNEILFFQDEVTGDQGMANWGEFAVGRPEKGSETVLGEGDSYVRGMKVYTYNPSGAVYTDVTTAAAGSTGSTFTFPAVAQNNAIYVASTLETASDKLQFFGIKSLETIAAVLGGGAFVVEYWNGAAWAEMEHMSTQSNSPYVQYAETIFERAQSEQIRFPIAFLSTWTKNDPMSLGTNYYWMRFRIASAITTAPTFQQFKLHTNRFEINADGVIEHFGASRYPKDLLVHQRLTDDLYGASPSSTRINFTTNIKITPVDNSFNDNALDGFGEIIPLPGGIDTSIPIVIEVIWMANGPNAGNVELEINYASINVGDTLDGTIADTNISEIIAVGAGETDVTRKTTFSVPVSHLVPGELLVFSLFRDALAGNTHDTLAENVEVSSLRAYGYFWRP